MHTHKVRWPGWQFIKRTDKRGKNDSFFTFLQNHAYRVEYNRNTSVCQNFIRN
jgi:hypothetical protein